MDVFVEQIVKKTPTGKDKAIKGAVVLGMCLLAAVCAILMLIIPGLALLLLVGICYGGYILLTNLDCEYEYIVTNGEIDVDKIIAKRKRRRLITAKASAFEAFGEYKDNTPDTAENVTTVSAVGESEDGAESGLYYADFRHPSAGDVRLIFTPEEKVVEAIVPFLPAQVRVNFRKQS